MRIEIAIGLLIPFFGTTLGSMMVLFMKNEIQKELQKILIAFAAKGMVSASFWSSLVPAIEQAQSTMGKWAVVPTIIGFCINS